MSVIQMHFKIIKSTYTWKIAQISVVVFGGFERSEQCDDLTTDGSLSGPSVGISLALLTNYT